MIAQDRGRDGSSAVLASFLGFGFLVDLTSMTNLVYDDQLLFVKGLVDYSVISFAILEQPGKVAFQGLRRDLFEVLS